MKFSHISDTHAGFKKLSSETNIVIHSGDMLPNAPYYDLDRIKEFQYFWMVDNIEKFKSWIGNRRFYFCAGNHDFLDSETIVHILKNNSIDAVDITNTLVKDENFTIYGSPYVPYIVGEWNYELNQTQMKSYVYSTIKELFANNKLDIFVSHAPIYKVLDQSKDSKVIYGNYGIQPLNTLFNYLPENQFPKYCLVGHIHSDNGIDFTTYKGLMIVSNAATTENVLEL